MAAENISLVMKKVDELVLEARPIPVPKADEVLIAMQYVGICGTDVHFWKEGHVGNYVVTGPMVLGHEPSGIISKVGSNVKNLKPGDRVAIEPGVPCRKCDYCLIGRYNLCQDIVFCASPALDGGATPPVDGTMSRFYVHHSAFCHKIADNMSMEEGALVEPMAVAVHACRKAEMKVGKTVLVTGSGPIGLVNLMTAKAMGAKRVGVIDIVPNRLEVAKKLGADFTILAGKSDSVDNLVSKVLAEFGRGPDITLECTGTEACLNLGCKVTRPGGVIVGIGLGPSNITLPFVETLCKEVDIRNIFRYANSHPLAIELIASGKVNVKPLITHRFPLEKAVEAFEVARTGAGGAIKVLVKCGQ